VVVEEGVLCVHVVSAGEGGSLAVGVSNAAFIIILQPSARDSLTALNRSWFAHYSNHWHVIRSLLQPAETEPRLVTSLWGTALAKPSITVPLLMLGGRHCQKPLV
jgi:hypothetical protein